jgi:hypothetical protein
MLLEKARGMTPAQVQEMVNGIPEQFRPQVLQLLRDNNIKIGN